MTTNTDIIILHSTKFGDNSLIIHTLSKDYGRRGFLVRGLGRRVNSSWFLPLNILEANIIETQKSDLYTIKSLTPKYPLVALRNNFYKNAITMFISEVLYRTLKDGTREDGLFEWCEREILLLDALEDTFSNFHLRFLAELTVQLGFSPKKEDLSPFLGDRTDKMLEIISSPFGEAMLIPLTGEIRNEMSENMLRYIEYHSESALNIRSLGILRELFSDLTSGHR